MSATSVYESVNDSTALSPQRLRLALLVGLSTAAIAVFIAYFVLAVNWHDRPFLGVTVNHTLVVNAGQPSSSEPWPGLRAGLKTGDQILSINGQDLHGGSGYASRSRAYQDVLNGTRVGDSISLEFTRTTDAPPENLDCSPITDGIVRCSVSYAVQRLPTGDFLALFVVPFVSGLVVLAVALLLLRLRPHDPAAFVPIITLLMLAMFMGGLFDVGSTHLLLPLWLVNGILLGGMLVVLGLVFPVTLPVVYARPILRYAPVIVASALAAGVLLTYADETPASLGMSGQITGMACLVGMAILAALLIFQQRPLASSSHLRNQANIVFVGVLLAMVPALIWGIGLLLQALNVATIPFGIESMMPFYIIPAISIAYAMLQQRRMDTDRVISQAVTYNLLLLALMIAYFMLVLGASLLTTEVIAANNPVVIAVLVFTVSVLFVPVRTRLERRIDAAFFRTRHQYQNLIEEFAQKLTTLTAIDSMIAEFSDLLDATIQPDSVYVFLTDPRSSDYTAYGDSTDIMFQAESGLVRMLHKSEMTIYLPAGKPWPAELHIDRARLNIIQAMVIAGMPGSESLNGFVSIGPPKSGSGHYSYEELRFINNLVGQLTIAVERAQAISALERRVRELDVLSQVGQAVNFTIAFDDLLELISAQTSRIIQAPYFYIVLHDQALDQLYYAFFLEDDERIHEHENRRWPRGRDLYSEVIDTGQPRLLDDYTKTMTHHQYAIRYESNAIKAWMGVPLIAGARTLGILAAGESDPERKFTSGQLRIFSDIGALAATSIDKARLFTEANVRARQLAALNDISRQLVASEGDVERLLQLITTSAVDILNAEAGSLLLTTEGAEHTLEYRALAGNIAEDLIGTRIDPSTSQINDVARTGQPMIFETPLDEGSAPRSTLAVPLVTQDRIAGVLEVINKRDGSVYVEDDVDLLTTFAGQAAIALENARLFQQTDLQLSQRVSELEALERIDVELNRTLDLNTVAEITVRWAIANCSATTGLLGIVTEDQQYLAVLHRSGYGDVDVPEGALSNLWPLDRGIVKRVMRTRRPDLQPDVEIDPDYIPSLRDSLSQITVPFISGDRINAMLVLETDTEPRLNLLDLDWTQRLAEHANIAIANAQLYTELTRANESKSEFVGFAAHELKNPLASVRGYAELMRSGMTGEVSEQQKNFLNIIRANADRMQVIIEDLRDVARIDAQQLKITPIPLDIHTIIEETLDAFRQHLEEKQQQCINNVPSDLPSIMGDRTRLIQVLTNLVSNAHKYSPETATITLDAQIVEKHRDHTGQSTGPALQLSVADNGIGMSAEDLQKIFHVRYFRSEDESAQKQAGTGLGMMISQHIIHLHRGNIWVESELGSGSTFHFTIPLASQEQTAIAD